MANKRLSRKRSYFWQPDSNRGKGLKCIPNAYMGVSQDWGYPFEGPNNEDYSILGSILGSPYFGKLPRSLLIGGRSVVGAPFFRKPMFYPFYHDPGRDDVGLPALESMCNSIEQEQHLKNSHARPLPKARQSTEYALVLCWG